MSVREITDTPGIGDNLMPAETDPLATRLLEAHAKVFERANELLLAETRLPAVGDETVAAVQDFVIQIAACIKAGLTSHQGEKEPFLAAGRTVDNLFFKRVRDPLVALKARVEAKITAHLRQVAEAERQRRLAAQRAAEEAARLASRAAVEAEIQRRRAEDAERERAAEEALRMKTEDDLAGALEREAEGKRRQEQIAADAEAAQREADQRAADAERAAQAAEANAAEMSRTRGDLGSVASLRTFWDARDLDRNTLDLEPLRPHLSEEELNRAVKSWLRANAAGNRDLAENRQPIRGVILFKNTKAQVR